VERLDEWSSTSENGITPCDERSRAIWDPDSEFYENLVDPFLEGEYFPLLYTRSAIQQNTAKRINLVPDQNS
jgi:hypothetical protein